ncbi:MAG: hypothetical protein ABR898_13790 [Terracidiphilus sp.]|jgi:hypothetical protein
MRMLPGSFSTRTSSRRVSCAARQALCLALLLALPGGAQNAPPQPTGGLGQSTGRHLADPFSDGDNLYPAQQERQLRALNAERQKLLVADTDRLLKLAAELDAEVSRDHPDSLTVDQLRRLAEIEKLARSVKEKMSTSVRGIPAFAPSFSPSIH